MKISIRVSILTIFTILLIAIGASIIITNNYVGQRLLLNFATKLITSANSNVKQRAVNFILPITERIHLAARAIERGFVAPGPNNKFSQFLLQLLKDQPAFSTVHWSNARGDFIFVERIAANTFANGVITCTAKHRCSVAVRAIDINGNYAGPLSRTDLASFDPRNRAWYREAIAAKTYNISDPYLFYYRPSLGITASYPLYKRDGELEGVLSIDMRLSALSDFIASLNITKNAEVFIFEAEDDLIAAKYLQANPQRALPKVKDIGIPWLLASFDEYQHTKKNLFSFTYQNEAYLASYDTIMVARDNPWSIGIVLPESDVTQDLMTALERALIIAMALVLAGIGIVSLVSKAIAKPIVLVAKDAQSIKNLDLTKTETAATKISHIKEVSLLQTSFAAMRSSLSSFVRYVPIEIVRNLLTSGEIANVGGDSKNLTFMFADIQGFTSMSENLEPSELMSYLSEYLEVMAATVRDNKGTLDKYIGDAIMAFWGAPTPDADHPKHACQCALAMLEALKKLNEHWQWSGKPLLKVRIGINSGMAVVGNVGSKDRLSYTVLGDSVNLAFRIEDINKLYKTTIIVGEETYKLTKEFFKYRLLDCVVVRGRQHGACIYEMLPADHPLNKINFAVYESAFTEAFKAYKQGDFIRAHALFSKMAQDYPFDPVMKLYVERCECLQKEPQANWCGVWKTSA